jgi:cysteinyl-tRNA synthetase
MESTPKEFHFEDLIIQTIENRKEGINKDATVDAMVKFLVEIRDSARRNENYSAYDHISDAFENRLGIQMKEQTRIVAAKK